MKKIKFDLASDSWGEEERAAIERVIGSNRYTMGREVRAFEDTVRSTFGVRHAVMVNSGSSANLVMLSALQIKKNIKQLKMH